MICHKNHAAAGRSRSAQAIPPAARASAARAHHSTGRDPSVPSRACARAVQGNPRIAIRRFSVAIVVLWRAQGLSLEPFDLLKMIPTAQGCENKFFSRIIVKPKNQSSFLPSAVPSVLIGAICGQPFPCPALPLPSRPAACSPMSRTKVPWLPIRVASRPFAVNSIPHSGYVCFVFKTGGSQGGPTCKN